MATARPISRTVKSKRTFLARKIRELGSLRVPSNTATSGLISLIGCPWRGFLQGLQLRGLQQLEWFGPKPTLSCARFAQQEHTLQASAPQRERAESCDVHLSVVAKSNFRAWELKVTKIEWKPKEWISFLQSSDDHTVSWLALKRCWRVSKKFCRHQSTAGWWQLCCDAVLEYLLTDALDLETKRFFGLTGLQQENAQFWSHRRQKCGYQNSRRECVCLYTQAQRNSFSTRTQLSFRILCA